jgi:hypothetical protein
MSGHNDICRITHALHVRVNPALIPGRSRGLPFGIAGLVQECVPHPGMYQILDDCEYQRGAGSMPGRMPDINPAVRLASDSATIAPPRR